jgi:hypothetical protein
MEVAREREKKFLASIIHPEDSCSRFHSKFDNIYQVNLKGSVDGVYKIQRFG